ncbi:L-type lectin-domain containing receptor kinase SIT2-like [Curcuma longa]|uniref:L-type lectin-domain containing receptor kinase SIT2-like n=1 Tax=Curcuma longa TaxID=136217 RepID=UPI003D9F281A
MPSIAPKFLKIFSFFLLLLLLDHRKFTACGTSFIFNGFGGGGGANLTLDGLANVTSAGLLMLTDDRSEQASGRAFYPSPLPFHNQSSASRISSFSTTFAVGIISEYADLGGHGLAFVVSPTTDFSGAHASNFLGLFNRSTDGDPANHLLAVELDTIVNRDFRDINNNHVGVDVNGLTSIDSHPAGYYMDSTGIFHNLSLIDGRPLQIWVEYDGEEMLINVTIAPLGMDKPSRPLLSTSVNLSAVFLDSMYVGFSSSVGSIQTAHYVLGWSFSLAGEAQALDLDLLPSLPTSKKKSKALVVGLPIVLATLLIIAGVFLLFLRRRIKYSELLEAWEIEFCPHRISYRDLFKATRGFKEKELLGKGGFGSVYKGVLPRSKQEIAVKRVSSESKQGMREFVAEIASLGRLRHRNLVQLLGYCRREKELLLVYDYMPNGSLDKFLYDSSKPTLSWAARFRIIKGVAEGLLYLHEDWEQVVVHRDIKASNVLLDGDWNARLGDFGMAKLYDHETDPATTKIVGTMGYLAPELVSTGRVTTATDVFAFGAFLLEVACGRRPFTLQCLLVDWVRENWRAGEIAAVIDRRLGEEYAAEEVDLVLKLGLLCSHPLAAARPSMRQVVRYLENSEAAAELPELAVAPQAEWEVVTVGDAFDENAVAALLAGGR